MHKKLNLPTKTCPVCDRPFTWRAKWRQNWDTVIYCSKRCGAEGRRRNRQLQVDN